MKFNIFLVLVLIFLVVVKPGETWIYWIYLVILVGFTRAWEELRKLVYKEKKTPEENLGEQIRKEEFLHGTRDTGHC